MVTDPSYLKDNDSEFINDIFESTRPYDGKIWIKARGKAKRELMSTTAGLDLYGAQLNKGWRHLLISRTGSLEGAAMS